MAAGRTLRSLISRRRRTEDEGEEDEEGPVVVEDSQSEGSVLSEPDDEEGDADSLGNAGEAEAGATAPTSDASPTESKPKKTRKPRKRLSKRSVEAVAEPSQTQSSFKAMADTEAMMKGLGISAQAQDAEAVDFESLEPGAAAVTNNAPTNGHSNTLAERQRREHEEYKKKRDSDPAFIPNRGNFFMHDTRGHPNGQPPPLRGVWQNRGRGRGGANVGGPFSPANQMAQTERAAEQQWKHDLHDTINEELPVQPQGPRPTDASIQDRNCSSDVFPRPAVPSNQEQSRVVSFSQTTLVGKVQIRVSLPGMKTPTTFSEIPWKHYTRLPDHRPPLRRDKPVRICLPGREPKFSFPLTDRSFIFIPRQSRPNQQGFHRGQYQRSIGGYGYSSRRTSMYGGSIYSGSVPPSRRGSFVGPPREHAFSPAGSFVGVPSNRPVGRLPHGGPPFSAVSTPIGPLSGHQTPTGMPPQIHTYPPPQQPIQFGTPTTTVHQPRPQKAISVTGIESPMLQQEPQPFQNQLPPHMNEAPPPYFSPQHRYPQPQPQPQPQAGTPLSGIPELAVHAPAFQPPGFQQPQFYPPYPPPQNFYYPPPQANGYPPQMQMYMMQPPHQAYMGPPPAHAMPQQHVPPPQPPPSQPVEESAAQQQAPSGMVAHESNGMVFYVPASEAQQSEHYQPAESFVPSYAMPGLPPPTPAPEGSMPYYYPPTMQQPTMQEVGSGVYYPAQPQQ